MRMHPLPPLWEVRPQDCEADRSVGGRRSVGWPWALKTAGALCLGRGRKALTVPGPSCADSRQCALQCHRPWAFKLAGGTL